MAFSLVVAFITGGGDGMNQLTACKLAAVGAIVAALNLNTSGLAETVQGFGKTFALPPTFERGSGDLIHFASTPGRLSILCPNASQPRRQFELANTSLSSGLHITVDTQIRGHLG